MGRRILGRRIALLAAVVSLFSQGYFSGEKGDKECLMGFWLGVKHYCL
jgi:hypothetical protein